MQKLPTTETLTKLFIGKNYSHVSLHIIYKQEGLQLVSWSLPSLFCTNMAIPEIKRSGVDSGPYQVKIGQRYINLNPGCLFVQQPPKIRKGSRGSLKILC